MDYSIFTNDAEKEEARKTLPGLARHPAWKWIERVLEMNVAYFREKLEHKTDFRSLEEVYSLQQQIAELDDLRNLPAIILREAQDNASEDDTDDVFEQAPASPDNSGN